MTEETMLVATHGPFELTSTGVVLTRECTFEEWADAVKWSQDVEQAVGFWLGDLLNLGEHKFGEKYSQALEVTHKSEQTLKNVAWVARSVPPERRRTDVSFSHHEVVAAMNPVEQVQWLEKAATEGTPVVELRAQVKASKAAAGAIPHTLWVVVGCTDAEDQTALYNRMIGEGRPAKMKLEEGK